MLKENKIVRRLFGEQYDIQHRLLNIILVVGILGVVFACLVSTVMHQNAYTIILSYICLVLFCLIFWIANRLKRSQLAIIIFAILCIFNFLFVIGTGLIYKKFVFSIFS